MVVSMCLLCMCVCVSVCYNFSKVIGYSDCFDFIYHLVGNRKTSQKSEKN